MNRRDVLAGVTGGTAAAAISGVSNAAALPRKIEIRSLGRSGHSYQKVISDVAARAERELASSGVPGMTMCLIDAEGFSAVGTFGFADIGARIPVQPSHRFMIGSISKSFAGLCVHRLAADGTIDLNAPMSRYLPDVALPKEPFLVRQLLSHTGGLPRRAPAFLPNPDPYLWTGFAPGSAYSYSNTGFALLGRLVETICEKPYPLALRDLVIGPLGISGLKEAIQAGDRHLYATGYAPLDTAGPNMPRVSLGAVPWTNYDTADCNIGANGDSMEAYLRFLISAGRGVGAPIFSDEAAQRFTRVTEAAASFDNGAGYASGLESIELQGRKALHHEGGMWGFTSSLTVDPETGVGCFVSVNAMVGGYYPENLTKHACIAMRAAREGPIVDPVVASPQLTVSEPRQYAGRYFGPDGDSFRLEAAQERLFLVADRLTHSVQRVGEDLFLTDHPRFGAHVIGFERHGPGVSAAWFNGALYGRNSPLPQHAVSSELRALEGTYVGDNAWGGWRCSIIAEGDRLVLENVALDRTKTILRRRDGYWQPEAASGRCERIAFEAPLNGVPQRLSVSGRALWRFHEV